MVSKSRLFFTACLLTLTGIFVASNIYTLIPIYDTIAGDFHAPRASVVVATSLFTLLYAIGLLFFGPASDRMGRKNVIVVGILASSFTTLAVGLAEQTATLSIARALQGLTLGSFAPVAFAYSFELYSFRARTLLLVFINAGFLMAGILGQLISSFVASYWSWQTVYFFFAGCYLLLFVLLWLVLPRVSKVRVNGYTNLSTIKIMSTLLRKPSLQKSYLITFTLLFTFVAFYDGVSRRLVDSADELLLLRLVGLIGTILALFTGRWIERFGLMRMFSFGVGLGIVSLIGLLIAQHWIAIMVVSVFLVASIAILIPCMITFIGSVGGEQKAKALSLYSFVLLLGASIASPLAAAVEFQTLIVILLGFFVCNGAIVWRLIRRNKSGST